MAASITGTLVPTIGLGPYSGKIAILGSNPRAGFDLGYAAGVADGGVTGRAAGYALGTTIGVDAGVILGRDQGASDNFAIARGAGLAAATPADTDPATITAVEPTPDTAPGDAGGFPSDPGTAAITPIVVDVTDADSFLVTVTHGTETEAIAYRAGLRGAYVTGSTVTAPSAGTLRLSLVPDGGWAVDAVVTIEAYRTGADVATFGATYLLPRAAVETAPAVEVSDGAVDLLEGAFALLPSYLASEAS